MSLIEILTGLEVGAIYGIIAMGIYLTLRILNIADLSCDGSFMAGGAACAALINAGINPIIGLLIGSITGGVVGLLTGMLVVYGRINSLHASILSAFIFYSVNLRIMGGVPNIPLNEELTIFNSGFVLPILLVICGIIWLIIGYVLQTNWGLALRCIGQNKTLATSYGIKISTYVLITLVASNALIGLGGSLFCQYQGFADISQGVGSIILGLAAIMIGEKLFTTKSISKILLLCIIGSMLYRLVIALALRCDSFGITSSDLNIIAGIIVIAIMLLRRQSNKEEFTC